MEKIPILLQRKVRNVGSKALFVYYETDRGHVAFMAISSNPLHVQKKLVLAFAVNVLVVAIVAGYLVEWLIY